MQISHSEGKVSGRDFLTFLCLLVIVLCFLFHKSFDSSQILFSNDAPLGATKAEMNRVPGTFTGNWQDINWIGGKSVSAAPSISATVASLLPEEIYLKLSAPFAMLLFGLCAWIFFRELGFHPAVCLLGGLAATLNMHAFSFACWGLGIWAVSFGMTFLAMAALVTKSIRQGWLRGVLAGTAVGIGLMEGFDVGAILSLYVAAFGLFVGITRGDKISGKTVGKAVGVVAIVAVFAAFTAAHTISTLLSTQVKGVVGMEQDAKSKEARWIIATQWSLPKMEMLRVLIPGIFGYRMVDGESHLTKDSYWGTTAQDPNYDQPGENYHRGLARFSGTGEYAGIFVFLVAVLAIAQSFRKQNSPFSPQEKKFVWFWTVLAFISLLLSLGRHAPFYQFVFAIPYFSTIRNPNKFMNPFHIALIILFAYGVESLVRRYLESIPGRSGVAGKSPAPSAFEKKWILFSGIGLAASVLGWMVYSSSKKEIVAHLKKYEFPAGIAPDMAQFSIGEVTWFIFFLTASVILLAMILRGKFFARLKLASILMGGLIVADLVHANVPWIVYQNYKVKYASNAVIDVLKDKPFEHRVMVFPFKVNDAMTVFQGNVYYTEWLQHHFLYYNIQTLDVAQEPRVAADNAAYREAFRKAGISGLTRMWQLANVRYFFGLADGFIDSINQQIDPGQKRFKAHTVFGIYQENNAGPYLVQTNSTGPFALIEFTGALPRAKIYGNWQVVTNDQTALEKLADPAFDPLSTVLVANEIPAPGKTISTNLNEGSVQFVGYHPKRIELSADVKVPSVLLLNDKYDSDWKVFVNGQEKQVLRCNYIMRGVQLDPGQNKIEFRFQPSLNTLYVSLAALLVGIGLCAFVAFGRRPKSPNAQKVNR